MDLQEIDLRNIYKMWKSGLGPFTCFFRSTPFVSLQTYDNITLSEDKMSKCNEEILNLITENCSENNFLIIDLPFSEILNLAFSLNNEYSIKPILNINLLFHPYGAVGNKDEINKLISYGLKMKRINTRKFVMLIPYDRYNDELKSEELKDKLNNQYGIGEDDLPYSNMLKELGYSKVTIISNDIIKDDLKGYIDFIDNDIRVEILRVRL